jgi:hypothetical protein
VVVLRRSLHPENTTYTDLRGLQNVPTERPDTVVPSRDLVRAAKKPSAPNTLLERYKSLTALHYAGKLTPEDSQELAKAEQDLDKVDSEDPDLQEFVGTIHAGYDKIEAGLQRVRGILDELIRS